MAEMSTIAASATVIFKPDVPTIAAAAGVILKLCEEECDVRTKLERIAYAAALIKWATDKGLAKINSGAEVSHA
jgi:hypothetical protein